MCTRREETYAGQGLDFIFVKFDIFEFDMGCHNYSFWVRLGGRLLGFDGEVLCANGESII